MGEGGRRRRDVTSYSISIGNKLAKFDAKCFCQVSAFGVYVSLTMI